jgi:hypothetical protein
MRDEAMHKVAEGGMTRTARLELPDGTHEFPVLSGSIGPNVVDIRKLYGLSLIHI